MTLLYLKKKTINGVKKIKRISYSTILVLEEAEKLGIFWKKIPYTDLFQLKYNSHIEYFHAQIPSLTTEFACYCCNHKRLTKNLLFEAGLAINKGYQIENKANLEEEKKIFQVLKKPVVVKLADGEQGEHVYLNLDQEEKYLEAIEKIRKNKKGKKAAILIEEMFFGDEYRILATQKKILSVIKRLPANVIGDGKSSIQELINVKNQQPLRNNSGTYKKIIVNNNLTDFLAQQNLNLTDIIENNKRIFLFPHSALDISLGGDTIDVTDLVHHSVHRIIKKLMSSIPGLSLAGIDYMSKDITQQQNQANYRIIEVNASPSLDWNEFPIEGKRRKIVAEFLKIMFPELP